MIIKNIAFVGIITSLIVSCGSPIILLQPEENKDTAPSKVTTLVEEDLKKWSHLDLLSDTVPGMSVQKAYDEIFTKIEALKPTPVIVGVLDSGIDIEHEDLKNIVWVNEDEIPNNKIDDDKNGYIDDRYGWNFLGDAIHEQLEFVRILKKGDDGSVLYQTAKEEYDKKYKEATENKANYEQLIVSISEADKLVQKEIGKESYTLDDLKKIETTDEKTLQVIFGLSQMLQYVDDVSILKEELKSGVEYYTEQLNYNLNKDYNGRDVVGDNPEDITDIDYGNNDVIGGDKKHARHGTHVAGIIAAQRNNNLGMNGVADHVKIMAVRTVPDGDEYDKDIALAIRYAVDNGAKIINGSFGKYFSPHKEWVWDAIKYAASKDVLIVKAAGNEALDIDETLVYPNDNQEDGKEIANNFLVVGALNPTYGLEMVAPFSNYGNKNVDVFAPGVKIWSTTTTRVNGYEYLQGTSMAAPAVAGVAALIRSYYPKLKAHQVKQIIMQSGLNSKSQVILGGNPNYKKPFSEASKSGKMVSLYNAMILADQVAAGKVKL